MRLIQMAFAIFLMIFAMGSMAFAGYTKDFETTTINVNIRTQTALQFTEKVKLSSSHSHIQIEWLNGERISFADLMKLIKVHGKDAVKVHTFYAGVSGRVSVSPLISGPIANRDADGHLMEKIDEARHQVAEQQAALIEGLNHSVDQIIANKPALAPFRPQLIDGAYSSQFAREKFARIDAANGQIDAAYKHGKEQNKKRVSDLVLEHSFQTFAVELGYAVEIDYHAGFGAGDGQKDKLLFYLRAGKLRVAGSGEVNEAFQSPLEEVVAENVTTQRLMSTAGTTAVNGIITYVAEEFTVQLDFYAGHNRTRWEDAGQYVVTNLLMTPEEYRRERNLARLDMVMGRILFNHKNVTFYLSLGKYDEATAFGVGTVIRLTSNDSIHIDYSAGDRKYSASSGFSIYYVRVQQLPWADDGNTVNLYLGYEKLDNYVAPHKFGSVDEVDLQTFTTGISKTFTVSPWGLPKTQITPKAGYFYDKAKHESGYVTKDHRGTVEFSVEF